MKDESKWVKQVFEWFVFDNLNYRQIATKLNKLKNPKGIANTQKRHRGSDWSDNVVRSMLMNTSYTGQRIERIKDSDGDKTEIIVPVPQIIPDLLFRQAKYLIQQVTETRKTRRRTNYLSFKPENC